MEPEATAAKVAETQIQTQTAATAGAKVLAETETEAEAAAETWAETAALSLRRGFQDEALRSSALLPWNGIRRISRRGVSPRPLLSRGIRGHVEVLPAVLLRDGDFPGSRDNHHAFIGGASLCKKELVGSAGVFSLVLWNVGHLLLRVVVRARCLATLTLHDRRSVLDPRALDSSCCGASRDFMRHDHCGDSDSLEENEDLGRWTLARGMNQ